MVLAMSEKSTLELSVLSICLAVIRAVPWVYTVHSAQSGAFAAVTGRRYQLNYPRFGSWGWLERSILTDVLATSQGLGTVCTEILSAVFDVRDEDVLRNTDVWCVADKIRCLTVALSEDFGGEDRQGRDAKQVCNEHIDKVGGWDGWIRQSWNGTTDLGLEDFPVELSWLVDVSNISSSICR